MQLYQPHLDWIASQQSAMLERTILWAQINSGSFNPEGLGAMADALESAFMALQPDSVERLDLAPQQSVDSKGVLKERPLGQLLRFRKRADAPLKVVLTGHYDTVYPVNHTFQNCTAIDALTTNGPGVADMKGGIVVMLHALLALERSPWADAIGWEVLLNPDEEIGSTGSAPYLSEAARRNDFGLTYEPSLPDGTLAGARKGSGNFSAVVRGRAAHAGRDPHLGRNAIVALSELILAVNALNGQKAGLTVNPGRIEGGGPVNVVPDLAICHFNIRVENADEQTFALEALKKLEQEFSQKDGISLHIHGGFTRPPKTLTPANHALFDFIKQSGALLGLSLQEKPTGGCCDGNNLAAAGLPNVDTLGVRGANIHSADEYMINASLTERAQLSALLLLRFASQEIVWNHQKSA
ncbi:MAG: hydrolase [Alphaproteobacteria bacterium]|nr:hydrolase [Alphaproteobacteria bacterium]